MAKKTRLQLLFALYRNLFELGTSYELPCIGLEVRARTKSLWSNVRLSEDGILVVCGPWEMIVVFSNVFSNVLLAGVVQIFVHPAFL